MADQMQQLQGMQFFDPAALAQLQADQYQLQKKQAMAQSLLNAGYIPNSGKAGLLAGVASMIRGKMLENEADTSVADILRRNIEMQNQAANAMRQRQLEDERRKLAEEIYKQTTVDRSKAQSEREFAKPELKEGFIQFDPATGKSQIDPSLQSAMLGMKQAGRAITNVMLANENAFQKALGEGDAKDFIAYRQGAQSATDTLSKLNQLKQITAAQQTGRGEEARALIGQYFGSDAAANMQAFNATAQPLILQAAQSMKGSLSDKDVAFLKQGMPSFGNDPRANAAIIGVLENAANRQIKNYQDAQSYVSKNKTLAGYMPSVQLSPTVPVPAPKASISAPPAAIARLKANPAEAAQFDEVFGQGSAAQILGGQ